MIDDNMNNYAVNVMDTTDKEFDAGLDSEHKSSGSRI